MNPAHIHLILNHIPVIGIPFVALVVAWGLFRRSREIVRFGLGLGIALAIFTYPVFLSGEPAEEIVEEATWAPESIIEQHEDQAKLALILVLVTGVLSAASLWRLRGDRPLSLRLPSIAFAALLVSSGMLALTSLTGGKIRHDEIRGDGISMPDSPYEQHETDDDEDGEQ